MSDHDCGCCKKTVSEAVRALADRKYGWDGGSALPIREDVADTLFSVFSWTYPICFGGLDDPTVEMCVDGTVELVFKCESAELILLFQCRNVVEFVTTDEETEYESSGVYRLGTAQGVADLEAAVDWLKGEHL